MQISNRLMRLLTPGRLLTLVVLAWLLMAGPVMASSGGSYDLSWWSVDGGGGTSSGDNYALNGSVGQADAGMPLSSGAFTVVGGFWVGIAAGEWSVYLPIILR